jgi:hypothetical protein
MSSNCTTTAPISTPSARMTLTAISASCTGNSIRINPTTSRNHPKIVTSTGQPPVHTLCVCTIASPATNTTMPTT